MAAQITIYHDTRRKKDNNLFPVKFRVWDSLVKRAKLYPLNIDLSIKDFNQTWDTQKPRTEYRERRKTLDALLTKANKVADKMEHFTFEEFERKLYRKSSDGTNVIWQYNSLIKEKRKNEDVGTADNYQASINSLIRFLEYKKVKNLNELSFSTITKDWLKEYELYMVNHKQRSFTTVGIYLRPLRAIFNTAIAEGEIQKEIYPFGKRQYQIPAPKGTKKALSNEQLKSLYEAACETPERQKAKDFWFFSYACNGMNTKDIALLKYSDIEKDSFTFYRAKTLNTSRTNLKPIKVYLNDFITGIIELHGNKQNGPNGYVFNIISDKMDAREQQIKIKNFTSLVNKHIKKICKSINLPTDVTTYWARHSFATNSVRKGASLEFMQESLGHGDLKTTASYFAGFDDDAKKEFAQNLMDF
jgi:site-specific recombinase XerD